MLGRISIESTFPPSFSLWLALKKKVRAPMLSQQNSYPLKRKRTVPQVSPIWKKGSDVKLLPIGWKDPFRQSHPFATFEGSPFAWLVGGPFLRQWDVPLRTREPLQIFHSNTTRITKVTEAKLTKETYQSIQYARKILKKGVPPTTDAWSINILVLVPYFPTRKNASSIPVWVVVKQRVIGGQVVPEME